MLANWGATTRSGEKGQKWFTSDVFLWLARLGEKSSLIAFHNHKTLTKDVCFCNIQWELLQYVFLSSLLRVVVEFRGRERVESFHIAKRKKPIAWHSKGAQYLKITKPSVPSNPSRSVPTSNGLRMSLLCKKQEQNFLPINICCCCIVDGVNCVDSLAQQKVEITKVEAMCCYRFQRQKRAFSFYSFVLNYMATRTFLPTAD